MRDFFEFHFRHHTILVCFDSCVIRQKVNITSIALQAIIFTANYLNKLMPPALFTAFSSFLVIYHDICSYYLTFEFVVHNAAIIFH